MSETDMAMHDAAALRNPVRRRVLAGLLSAYTVTLIPWAAAQSINDNEHGAFLAISALLAGRQSLDTDLATRLYDELQAQNPGFTTACTALLTLINKEKIDPLQLQKTLDATHPKLAPLPRKIATAWLSGIVGKGEQARCLAYENALNAVMVSDVLKPPSYAYGDYGSWEEKPI